MGEQGSREEGGLGRECGTTKGECKNKERAGEGRRERTAKIMTREKAKGEKRIGEER